MPNADGSPTAAEREAQRQAQTDQQDSQTASMASMYGGRGAWGGGMMGPGGYTDEMAPGYGNTGGGGIMPARDNGFSQYWAHHLAAGVPLTGRISQGPYKGMFVAAAQEKAREDWAKLSPEQRQPYYQREFNQDEADPSNPSSFFSKSQKDQVAPEFDKDFAALQARTGTGVAAPQSPQAIGSGVAAPASRAVAPARTMSPFNPGSINDGPLADNDTRPHYGMDQDSQDLAPAQSTALPRGALPTGISYKPLAQIPGVQQPSPAIIPHPMYDAGGTLQTMGDSADTAKYGPVNAGLQKPQFDAGGTLISPLDKVGANGMVADTRAMPQRPSYLNSPPPMPAARPMASVK